MEKNPDIVIINEISFNFFFVKEGFMNFYKISQGLSKRPARNNRELVQ